MRAILLMLPLLALAACSTDGKLMGLRSGDDGPDEFAILPTRPLEMPTNLAELPTPTPGGSNITDPNPAGDAVAALGGNPGALGTQGVSASDGALLAYTGRNGRDANIRQVTATEDQAFRQRHGRRLLEVWAKSNVYYRAYRGQTLDSWAELERWRPTGVQTPTAPPR